jgi:hypothetical protein
MMQIKYHNFDVLIFQLVDDGMVALQFKFCSQVPCQVVLSVPKFGVNLTLV